jgi:RNase H-fold protein (predicted Holliday junction resolvase)
MTRNQREILRKLRQHFQEIEFLVEEWQDESRTYTPAERNLAVRLDRRFMPA